MSRNYDTICLTCYLPDCIEFSSASGKGLVCPRMIARRLKLTPEQGRQLSQVARIRNYPARLFVRMAEIQAERNAL